MAMRIISRAGALCAMMALVSAFPASSAATAAKAKPTQAQVQTAALRFHVLVSAMESAKIEDPVKNALFSCAYEHSMAEISDAMDKAIASHPGKVDSSNPNQLLAVMAGVCGYRPAKPEPTR